VRGVMAKEVSVEHVVVDLEEKVTKGLSAWH
jgi:hypothetical protein